MGKSNGLEAAISAWLETETSVEAAVLVGSTARSLGKSEDHNSWLDVDLHLITTNTQKIENLDWTTVLPGKESLLTIVRPATGGVRKTVVLFEVGQLEMVLIPARSLFLARVAMGLGMQRKLQKLETALNEVRSTIQSGYRFMKGEKKWGKFYARILNNMPGVRLSNSEACYIAELFLCELILIFQKLDRGEVTAAQHSLHRALAESNFRLMREMCLRRNRPLTSFGLARHAEILLEPKELDWVQIDARLNHTDLRRATWKAFEGLKQLMRELVPNWEVSQSLEVLLARRLSLTDRH